MSILKTTDFSGYHKLAGSIENDILLQSYIDKYEKKAIYMLFGIKLGKLIIADIEANDEVIPDNADYLKIWEPFEEVGPWDEQWISEGVAEILKSFIFWEYIAFTTVQHTQAGVTTAAVDTQTKVNSGRFAESRWNNMLESWEVIQCYIDQHKETYPEYVFTRKPDAKFDGLL